MPPRLAASLLAALALAGCRTELAPVVRTQAPTRPSGPAECNVTEYPGAAQVPEGAVNLGWVDVAFKDDARTTFELLKLAVCALGGDAVSQLALVRPAANQPPSGLQANAWKTAPAP